MHNHLYKGKGNVTLFDRRSPGSQAKSCEENAKDAQECSSGRGSFRESWGVSEGLLTLSLMFTVAVCDPSPVS
ncbi:hypothetical protein Nepgr_032505 [Nepenthes gracilis]|uniref:Uncharacterized protein n=1 Tax=Nepenthes gracilis TaxID=150966 RepID=A0AAD3TKZ3_NEPGR|nr:hypothetical protein Nepgr_032505 [Nepenthes gracilis]